MTDTDGRAFGFGCATEANCAGAGDYPARQHAAVHFVSDLRTHRRLPEEVVLRYWGARESGRTARVIQTPEVDEQLAQARSTLATAQANLNWLRSRETATSRCLKKHAVAQQDVDNAVGTYSANKAIVDADMANVRHYEALVSFEKVYAPFDGVITARNTDIGDLINSGSSSTAKTDLFTLPRPAPCVCT